VKIATLTVLAGAAAAGAAIRTAKDVGSSPLNLTRTHPGVWARRHAAPRRRGPVAVDPEPGPSREGSQRYAAVGIPHYWLVDSDARRMERYRLEAGAYRLVIEAETQQVIAHPDWVELTIPLASLWR
jgi:Putative restriction endonuclease